MTKTTKTREELLDRLHEVVAGMEDISVQLLVEGLELALLPTVVENEQPYVLRFVNEPKLKVRCVRMPEMEERCQRVEQGWRREAILVRIDSVRGYATGDLMHYMVEVGELSQIFLCPWAPGSDSWSWMMSDGKEFECKLEVE